MQWWIATIGFLEEALHLTCALLLLLLLLLLHWMMMGTQKRPRAVHLIELLWREKREKTNTK